MSEIVYLNGEFVPAGEARISPNDRGFIFADGVYEVTKYYKGKPFRYPDHLARLKRSLAELDIEFQAIDTLNEVFTELLAKNGFANSDAGIYVQISRGTHKRIHKFPQNIEPTIYAYTFASPTNIQNIENGIKVITSEDIRWQRCDIKSVSLLPPTMLYNKAAAAGAGECILIRNGFVTEATFASVCAIKNGVLVTRPLSNLILPGVTRKVVLEICRENNIPIEERLFTEDELYQMDELFITGTGIEITPVVQINDKIVGNNQPGEITKLIQQKFYEMVPK
jgi:D-alanine transaminase